MFEAREQSPRKAVHMARGNINPITQEVMDMYSPSKAASPLKPSSSSWACSAMGSSNKQYPVAVQAKLPMATSTRLSRPFKPPSKSERREGDGVLRDEELMSLYSSSATDQEEQSLEYSAVKPQGPSLSKFFDTEQTNPEDLVPAKSEQRTERIYTIEEQEEPASISSPPITINSQSCAPRKRLFEPTNKLARFAFANSSKRQKSEDVQQVLSPPQAAKLKRNPFSILQQEQPDELQESQSVGSMSCDLSSSQQEEEESQSVGGMSCDLSSTQRSSSMSQQSQSVGNTSYDSSYTQRDPFSSQHELPDQESQSVGSMSCDLSSTGDSLCQSVTEEWCEPESSSSRAPPASSLALKRSWGFGSNKKPLAEPGKPKQRRQSTGACKRVGLSKKMKPSRLSDPGPGQAQLQFSEYLYAR